jgi:Protein of unknown function (DUF2933)
MNHTPSQHDEPRGFWCSRYAVGLLVMGAVAAYFLFSEHRAHFFGALPFLLLLACPLMHVFMHGSHGGLGGGHGDHRGGLPGADTAETKTGEQPRQPS